jgi:hypothetical protein
MSEKKCDKCGTYEHVYNDEKCIECYVKQLEREREELLNFLAMKGFSVGKNMIGDFVYSYSNPKCPNCDTEIEL